ncbi:hypothetical protein K456DRAFT_1611986 [Colletotrichum gloeosporioides 23]|nr:hypothetical protein K456DRAFT_1611986 [Colletotrichum gloeosporioides 23]
MSSTTDSLPVLSTGGTSSSELRAVRRDDTIVPATCYSICNDAYVEAQSVGKSPVICEQNSTFQTTYLKCKECIEQSAEDVKATQQMYLAPKFQEFLDFCTGASTTSTTPSITYPASMFITTTSLVEMDITQLSGKVLSGVLVPVTITELRQEATTMVATTSPAKVSPSILPSETVERKPTKSSAWIAGPVIGVLTAICSSWEPGGFCADAEVEMRS